MTNSELQNTFCTCDEMAAILKCSPKHVRELCRAKKIPAISIGRAWRIPRDQALAALGYVVK